MDPTGLEAKSIETPNESLTTADAVAKRLSDIQKAIEDETAEKGKAVAGITEAVAAIKDLKADMMDRMRFDSAETRAIGKAGGMKALMRTPTKDAGVKYLQDLSDDIHILDGILGHTKRVSGYGGVKSLPMWPQWDSVSSDFAKLMDTAESGAGAEWVPTDTLSSELLYAIELEAKVSSQFPSFNMPQSPFTWPIIESPGTAYRAVENTDITSLTKATATKLGTKKTQFDAEKIMGRIGWSWELDVKSLMAMLPEIKKALARGHANAKDYGVIDGQITAVIDTGDDPSGTATDPRNCWDGLRYYANANSKEVDLGSNWDAEGLNSQRKLLGAAGVNPDRCRWFCSIETYYELLTLKDNAGAQLVLAPWLYGPSSTIITGKLGTMYGIPIVPSAYVRTDLNASGIHDGVTETKTVLICAALDAWKFGRFAEIQVRASDELYMESDALVVVSREAGDFQSMFTPSVTVAASVGYNITP